MKGQLSLAFEMKVQLEIIQIDPDGGSRAFHDFLPYIFNDLAKKKTEMSHCEPSEAI
jgi:hypothetical protein